jgi:hypothetical protein
LAVAGIYLMFRQRVLLHNPATGAMWRRTSALGIETELVVTGGLAPLSFALDLPHPLDYPPSVTALYVYEPRELWWLVGAHPRNAYAYHVFRAAVIGLLARDVIGVRFAGSTRSRLGGRPRSARDAEYLIVPGENVTQDVDGVLEERIVDVVRYWRAQPAAKQWPQGATIYELARAMYENDVSDPSGTLINLVQKDAAARGLGPVKYGSRFFAWKLEVPPECAGKPRQEGLAVRSLYDQIARSHPGFIRALRTGVSRGIHSRTYVDMT